MNVDILPINNLNIAMGYRFKSFYTSNSYTNKHAAFRMSAIPGNTGKEHYENLLPFLTFFGGIFRISMHGIGEMRKNILYLL